MTINTVIKVRKRTDMWDYYRNEPIEDEQPIGLVMEVEGAIPESFIKWVPNKIFDRRKYPELYNLFGKDHLPNENEMKCFREKHNEEWFSKTSSMNEPIIWKVLLTIGGMIGLMLFLQIL